MTETRGKQIGGDHYVKHKIQPWDIIEEYNLGFWDGNAIKYILRYKEKGNPLEDIDKAIHYLEHVRELILRNNPHMHSFAAPMKLYTISEADFRRLQEFKESQIAKKDSASRLETEAAFIDASIRESITSEKEKSS